MKEQEFKLRTIDFEKEEYFDCGGKRFFVKKTLSFVRYQEMQRLGIEFGYSATFQDIFHNLQKSMDAFNAHKYDEMCIIVHNVMNGITKIEGKRDPALRLCALFIDEKDEDPRVYNEAAMTAKIDCWASELEVSPFISLAASLVAFWIPAYEMLIRNGSKEEKEQDSSKQSIEK